MVVNIRAWLLCCVRNPHDAHWRRAGSLRGGGVLRFTTKVREGGRRGGERGGGGSVVVVEGGNVERELTLESRATGFVLGGN